MSLAASSSRSVVLGIASDADPSTVAHGYALAIEARESKLCALVVSGSAASLARLTQAVGTDPRVRYVEPLTTYQRAHARDDPATTIVDARSGWPYEWAFSHVGVDKALNLTRGDANILVGVVDSGWAQIRELSGKIAHAWYYTGQSADALDTEGHGTFVASIIAAPNDDSHGLAGFCGACRLDVFKDLALTQFSTAGALRRLVDDHVRIINLSLGAPSGVTYVMADALQYAIQNGVLVVASSGNEGVGRIDAPAWFLQPANGALGYGLAVGASDRNDNRASFSNWGANLSLLAPGDFSGSCDLGIWAALPTVATEFDGGGGCNSNYVDKQTGERYAYASGTSFSAPEVAGVAALVWAARPELKNYELAHILEESATRPPGTSWTPEQGWGVLNAARALETATGRSSADVIVINDLFADGPARARRIFTLNAQAAWQDNVPVSSGTAVCSARVGSRSLGSRTSAVNDGSASCTWRIPVRTTGKQLTGTITVSDSAGTQSQRPFRFRVRR